jgi:hypothetical protein
MLSIDFPAGVTTLLSKSKKIANWRDGNLMRWDDGVTLRPIPGWEQVVYPTAFASRVRAIHRWMAISGIFYTAYLCESHCYIDTGGVLFDATPTGGMATAPPSAAGYGELNYGEETYGTPRSGISTLQKFSSAWSINNWGEDLLFMSSYDGRLLMWKPSTATVKAVAVTGAPTNNRQFVVTPDRHCILFQMGGNFADFGWCSAEVITDWNFTSTTNTAGFFTLDPYSPIIAAHSSAAGFSVHTPAMTHFVDYVGLPYVYRRQAIGKIPIPISAASMSSIPEGIIWISVEGFWMFNGSTADVIPCPIWDLISANMDFERTVRESHSVNMLSRGEIWWFWVDSSLGLEPTRYAAFDYRGKVWMSGYLHRTCGNTYANDRFPIMSDGTKVWKHETGFSYPNALFMPYLESQTLNIADGEWWGTIDKILPDIAGDRSALAFRLALNNDRTAYSTEKYTTQRTVNEHGWVDIRETGRDARLRIDMVKNSDWSTIGPIIFDFKRRGKKR